MRFSALSLQNFLFFCFIFLRNWMQACLWLIFHTRCRKPLLIPSRKEMGWAGTVPAWMLSQGGASDFAPGDHQCFAVRRRLSSCPFDSLGLLSRRWSMPGNAEGINEPLWISAGYQLVCMYCRHRSEELCCVKLYSWEQKDSSGLYTDLNKGVFRTWGILSQSWEYCFHAWVLQVTQFKNK